MGSPQYPDSWHYSRDIAVDLITADQLVSNAPAYLFALVFTASASGAATATIYDGSNATGVAKLKLSAAASKTEQIAFTRPLCFSKGIYVDLGDNVSGLTLQYQSFKE